MNRLLAVSLLLLCGLTGGPLRAQSAQDLRLVQQAAEKFARAQTAGIPGQVEVRVGAIEPVVLPPCPRLEGFLPLNAKLWGNAMVGVRCVQGPNWTLYVPVTVTVQAPVVVAARPLPNGRVLTEADLGTQVMELTQLPPGVLTDVREAVGKTLTVGAAAGHPLRGDMLRAPLVIRQGQRVRLIAQGQGFRVTSEGKALGNAAAGETVQVRAPSGQVVTGVARADGAVDVQY